MSSLIKLVTGAFRNKTAVVNWVALVAATLTLWTSSDVVMAHPEIAGVFTSVLAGINVVLGYLGVKPEDK